MTQTAANPAPAEPPRLSQTIGKLAGILASDDFPTGERAALKRMNPGLTPPLAFYRFAFHHLPEHWEHRQTEWVTLVAGIALMHPSPHQSDLPAGQVLAKAGYAESRLERLLAAEDETLETLLLRAARFLAAKGAPLNWTDFARLLLAGRDSGQREAARLRIARDFYRELDLNDKDKKD
jgi:CRISPR system Cascade subunit CasB